jgi:DNA-binding NarL/FixJ family response regulator
MKEISVLNPSVDIVKQIYFENKLTKKEQEVVKYLISGSKNNHIANVLGLKPNTISTMKRNIFFKLKVDSLIQLYDLFLQSK